MRKRKCCTSSANHIRRELCYRVRLTIEPPGLIIIARLSSPLPSYMNIIMFSLSHEEIKFSKPQNHRISISSYFHIWTRAEINHFPPIFTLAGHTFEEQYVDREWGRVLFDEGWYLRRKRRRNKRREEDYDIGSIPDDIGYFFVIHVLTKTISDSDRMKVQKTKKKHEKQCRSQNAIQLMKIPTRHFDDPFKFM